MRLPHFLELKSVCYVDWKSRFNLVKETVIFCILETQSVVCWQMKILAF